MAVFKHISLQRGSQRLEFRVCVETLTIFYDVHAWSKREHWWVFAKAKLDSVVFSLRKSLSSACKEFIHHVASNGNATIKDS